MFRNYCKAGPSRKTNGQLTNQLHSRSLLNYLDRLFVHGNELALHTQRNGRFDIFERDRTAQRIIYSVFSLVHRDDGIGEHHHVERFRFA